VTKDDGVVVYTPGGSVTYSIIVNNAGPSDVTGATVTDTFPAEITSANWACTPSGSATCTASGSGNISDTVDIPAGESLTYTVTADIDAGATGNLVNTASVSTAVGDPNPGDESDTDTDTPDASADLTVTKSDGVATYTPGGSVTYAIVVSNTGPSGVTGATVTDSFPAEITSANWTCTPTGAATCTASGSGSISDTVDIPAGENLTYTVTANIDAGATGNLVNTASISTAVGDPNPGDESATDTDTQSASADLTVTKDDGIATYTPGGSVTYTIVVSNAGPSDVTGVTVTDTFPTEITSANWTCMPTGAATCTASGSGSISDTVDVPAGESLTYSVAANIDAAATGNLINTASVSTSVGDPNPGDESATDTDTPAASADLTVTKDDGVATYTPGGSVTYTIVVSNAGPSDVTGATVADTFPASITSANWACAPTGAATCTASGSGDISDTVDIPAGESVTYSVTVAIDPAATGNLVNTASVTASVSDPNPGNDSATDTDSPAASADLSVTKDDGVATYTPGGSVTYTIVVGNAGPADVSGATVTDTFPVAITSSNWTCTPTGTATCTAGGSGDISDTVDLPVGESVTYSVTADIDAGATGNLVNTVHVEPPGGTTDPEGSNDSATDTDTQGSSVGDLGVTIDDGVSTYTPGGSLTYTIVVVNEGPSAVDGAVLADPVTTLPQVANATWTCVAAGGASCTAGPIGGDLNDTIDLPVGGTATYTLITDLDPGATGALVNTVTVSPPAGTTDPILADNSATDTDTVGAAVADLSITKDDGVVAAAPGTSVTYTITVSNAGPSNVTNVPVDDTFDPVFFDVAGVAWNCSVSAGTAACNDVAGSGDIATTVSLDVGAAVTIIATAPILPGAVGTPANTATVSAPAGVTDPDLENNSGIDDDTVLTSSADLSLTKTVDDSTPTPGDNVNFTLTTTREQGSGRSVSSTPAPLPR